MFHGAKIHREAGRMSGFWITSSTTSLELKEGTGEYTERKKCEKKDMTQKKQTRKRNERKEAEKTKKRTIYRKEHETTKERNKQGTANKRNDN